MDWFLVGNIFMKKINLLLIICVFAFGLFSCASTPSVQKEVPSTEKITREIESSLRVKAMNEKLLMSSFSQENHPSGLQNRSPRFARDPSLK
jgi:hypothetical protein